MSIALAAVHRRVYTVFRYVPNFISTRVDTIVKLQNPRPNNAVLAAISAAICWILRGIAWLVVRAVMVIQSFIFTAPAVYRQLDYSPVVDKKPVSKKLGAVPTDFPSELVGAYLLVGPNPKNFHPGEHW